MHLTGIEDHYIIKDNKKLRFGFTTGTCAAAAAKAAAVTLLTGQYPDTVRIETPSGITLNLEVVKIRQTESLVCCGIVKDGGDDPDATNGLMICAQVSRRQEGLVIDGGKGVGRVTKAGLKQAVGEAAINPVPMEMIRENVSEIMNEAGYKAGLSVIISVPEGEKAAEKTFNPRLGIIGGISILGTRGIVEPMSERALVASIQLEMDMRRSQGAEYLLVTPGNYGRVFSSEILGVDPGNILECSNYVGEMLDAAVNRNIKGVLLVSHAGKLIKVAGGIMNTHSRDADCRAELMTAFALRSGADLDLANRILDSNTTDEALDLLEKAGIKHLAMKLAIDKAAYYMDHRTVGAIQTEAIMYGGDKTILGQTDGAGKILELFLKRQETC